MSAFFRESSERFLYVRGCSRNDLTISSYQIRRVHPLRLKVALDYVLPEVWNIQSLSVGKIYHTGIWSLTLMLSGDLVILMDKRYIKEKLPVFKKVGQKLISYFLFVA